jgi:hypothetical protein
VFPKLHLVDASSVPVDERVTSTAFFRHASRLAAEAEAHVAACDNVVVWCDTGLAKAPAVVALMCRGIDRAVSGIVNAVAHGRQVKETAVLRSARVRHLMCLVSTAARLCPEVVDAWLDYVQAGGDGETQSLALRMRALLEDGEGRALRAFAALSRS